jgi:hypothetical protein
LKALSGPGKSVFDILMQRTVDGKKTGDLITEYHPEFYDQSSLLRKRTTWDDSDSRGKYFEWMQNNQIVADVRKLFPDTDLFNEDVFSDAERDEHLAELTAQLGKSKVDEILSTLELRLAKFRLEREMSFESIDGNMEMTPEGRELQKERWERENSPYWYCKDFYEEPYAIRDYMELKSNPNSPKAFRVNPKGYYYTYSAPRKTDLDGNALNWQNKKFEELRKPENRSVFELYEYITNVLQELHKNLPYNVREDVRYNTLPTLRKTFIESFLNDGMAAGFESMWDKMIESTTTGDISSIYTGDTDPDTGETEYSIDPKYIQSQENAIREQLSLWKIDYELKNNASPTDDEMAEAYNRIRDEFANGKSHDLIRLIKAYSVMSLGLKHKEAISDELKFLHGQLKNLKNVKVNPAGKAYLNDDGVLSEGSINNYLSTVESEIGRFFGTRKVEWLSEKKWLTRKEKMKVSDIDNILKELEGARSTMKESEYEKTKNFLTEQRQKVGGVITGSKIIDNAIRYLQLKTLGWNPFSASINLLWGQAVLAINASANQDFGDKELGAAMKLMLNSVRHFWTGRTSTKNKEAIKIRALMDYFRLPGEQSAELYNSSPMSTTISKFKGLLPFNLQRATEYLNYGPAMIASMMHKNITYTDPVTGEEKTARMWDVFSHDEVYGFKWNEDKYGPMQDEVMTDYLAYASVLAGKIQGNYDTLRRQSGKDTVIGRMLFVFRTWFGESVEGAYGPEYKNYALGRTVKGRYRSFAALSDVAEVRIGNSKFTGPVGAALYTLKQLGRKLAGTATLKSGIVTEYDGLVGEKFSEVDAANMRKCATEIYMYMTIASVYMALKYAGDDDDEKNRRKNVYATVVMNSLFRVQQDMTFLVNPVSLEQINKNVIPVTALITDVGNWMGAWGDFLKGEDEYETGIYEGSSKLLRRTSNLIPLANVPYKVMGISKTLLDK